MARTFVAFLLDETGSMMKVKQSTIDGYNLYVKGLQDDDNKYRFTLVKFDSNHITTVHDGVKVKKVDMLNGETYTPGAFTPLYDAIVHIIRAVEVKNKKKVIVVIMTDGEENASKEYSLDYVRELITEKTAEGWAFVFLGSNQDAWKSAQVLNISVNAATTYQPGQEKEVFRAVLGGTRSYSKGVVNASNVMEDYTDSGGKLK